MTADSKKGWKDAMESSHAEPEQRRLFSPKTLIVIGLVVLLGGLWWRGQQEQEAAESGGTQNSNQQVDDRPHEAPKSNEGTPPMHADPYPGYYQAYAMPAELVEGEIALTAWGGAAEKYHSGDYEGAATAFQEVLEAGGEMPVELVQFFLGQAHLAAGAAEPAAAAFRQVIEGTSDSLVIEARWYLALSCVRTGDVETAKEQLGELVNGKTYNADTANMLLKQISG
jgi:TolA-binding protein